jgi:hypothetical protein
VLNDGLVRQVVLLSNSRDVNILFPQSSGKPAPVTHLEEMNGGRVVQEETRDDIGLALFQDEADTCGVERECQFRVLFVAVGAVGARRTAVTVVPVNSKEQAASVTRVDEGFPEVNSLLVLISRTGHVKVAQLAT